MNSIVLAKDFDVAKVTYNDVRLLDNGGKVVFISYNKTPFMLQTPTMYVPFGVQKWSNEGQKDKWTCDLSFRGMEEHEGVKAFYTMLSVLDKKLVEDGFKNQQTWFKGKKYNSVEVLEALYTPLLRFAKDKNTGEVTDKYPPSFKMTIPNKDNVFTCEVYDEKRERVDLNDLNTKGSRVSAIIQCSGVWFAGGKFGISWRVVQMKVMTNKKIEGFAFQDDPDDTVAGMEDLDPKETVQGKAKNTEDTVVKSDDENDNDDDVVVSDSDDDLEASSSKKVVVKRRT